MLLALRWPELGRNMVHGTVHRVFVADGKSVDRGDALFELRIDLTDIAAQNCGPVSFFRIVAAESGWTRSVHVAAGEHCRIGDPLALLSTQADEPMHEDVVARGFRVSVVGVLA
jgi:hypothetical protein